MDDDVWLALARVGLAALLGAAIGLDRELRGHAAGLRTNILVCAAAAAFSDVSINGFAELRGYDPSRVAADVVSGIGFLGAGAIFAMGGRPRGLTTAAALWASAAIGLSVGVGRWQVAIGLVLVSLIVLVVVDWFGNRLLPRQRTVVRDIYLVLRDPVRVNDVQHHLHEHGIRVRHLDMAELGDYFGVDLVLTGREAAVNTVQATLRTVEGVAFVSDERAEESER